MRAILIQDGTDIVAVAIVNDDMVATMAKAIEREDRNGLVTVKTLPCESVTDIVGFVRSMNDEHDKDFPNG